MNKSQDLNIGELKVEGTGEVTEQAESTMDGIAQEVEENEQTLAEDETQEFEGEKTHGPAEKEKTEEEMANDMPTDDDAVEYNPKNSPMEELAEEETTDGAITTPNTYNEAPVPESSIPQVLASSIDESKTIAVSVLKMSDKEGFDVGATQDARKDDRKEGGIAVPRTTGVHKTSGDASEEGHMMIIEPMRHDEEAKKTMYEMSGFSVSYEPRKGEGLLNKAAADWFPDLETAQASINDDKYLMPIKGGGFRIVEITSGAPIISYEDRQLYRYIEGRWTRV